MSKKSKQPRYVCRSGARSMVVRLVPGIILYPSLLTPELLFERDRIFLILLGKKNIPIKAQNVNWQLKLTENLDVLKSYTHTPLYKPLGNNIRIKDPKDISDDAIFGNKRYFGGSLDKRIIEVYKKSGFTKVYNVSIRTAGWDEEGIYNLFWLYSVDKSLQGVLPRHDPRSGQQPPTIRLTKFHAPTRSLTPNEYQDIFVRKALTKLKRGRIKGGGWYKFHVTNASRDVDIASIDLVSPIQSYHPLFYYRTKQRLNIAQLSDLHVSSRQNVLCKSPARVIEYAVNAVGGTREEDGNVSPEIGSMVGICSKNIKQLLDEIGQKRSIHVLFLAGDLIDYIRNVYSGPAVRKSRPSVKDIWNTVAIDGSYDKRYQCYVDYVSIYSLLVYFCTRYKKPVFVVSGNHDCYLEPYGISPRVLSKRANEGIPADHNLTIYEAILAFGKTYAKLKSKSNFTAEKLKWFYSVLTPFSSYFAALPLQALVGLGWGDDEHLLAPIPGYDWHQGNWGHLPRANRSISDLQLKLVKTAVDSGKRAILLSHFTFVSYFEDIPFNTAEEGDVEFDSVWRAKKFDMGTFHKNRKTLYEKYMEKERRIHCALSGHSHRRGVYSIIRTSSSLMHKSVKTAVKEYAQFNPDAPKALPAVVVTDSAGPLPRYNWAEEFNGWGSASASGGAFIFDDAGNLRRIRTIETSVRARFVVALDYLDIIAKKTVLVEFVSDKFEIRREKMGNVTYAFHVVVPKEIAGHVYVREMLMYVYSASGEWKRISLTYDRDAKRWKIQGRTNVWAFRYHFSTQHGRALFLSIRFGCKSDLLAHYDFDSPWNFEFQLDHDTSGGGLFGKATHKKYIVKRDPKRAEIPDFEWRKKLPKYQ